jgi:uracil-DNA glycosylase family 4
VWAAPRAAWQRHPRVRVQRPTRQSLGTAVLFRGIRDVRRCERVVVAEGNPQHQGCERDFDQPREQQDPEPQRHLVAWREQVARERRAAFSEERYWGRPLPGFGDPAARVVLLGLAPAAHGANRTGRVFTGDRSGDFLFAALWRTGFANQPSSRRLDDGLELCDAWITAAVRCAPPANRPTPAERDECLPWSVQEMQLLAEVRVVVCLGAFAWDAALRLSEALAGPGFVRRRPRPRFGHGAELAGERYSLIGCYHPSQQNTFTGRLTEPMIDAVLERARGLAADTR